jgi:hypothetical protein
MVIILLLLALAEESVAQDEFPELSPPGVLQQTVGDVGFEIRYGRPAARKRKIMGGLVPYQWLWRTGAGKGTTISFDGEVTINKKQIPAGVYALVTIPDENEWVVMLNRDTTRIYGHPSEYDPANEVVRLTVKPEETDRYYESLTIDLDIVRYDAILYLSWENTRISFQIGTGTHERTMSYINEALRHDPRNPELLARASYYYSMNNEDPGQVLEWLDLAISSGGDRWVYHQKLDMLERLGRYIEARKAAGDAIAYLQLTKPVEWDGEIAIIRDKMKKWPK